jgi:hypothetical protein
VAAGGGEEGIHPLVSAQQVRSGAMARIPSSINGVIVEFAPTAVNDVAQTMVDGLRTQENTTITNFQNGFKEGFTICSFSRSTRTHY